MTSNRTLLITHTCNTKEWSAKKAVAETSQTNVLVLYRVSSLSINQISIYIIYIHICIYVCVCVCVCVYVYVYVHMCMCMCVCLWCVRVWKQIMKSFSNEALDFPLRKFWATYILVLYKTIWVLRLLPHKYTGIFQIKRPEHCRTMCLWICYFAPVISQRYIKYTLMHSSKRLAYLLHVRLI